MQRTDNNYYRSDNYNEHDGGSGDYWYDYDDYEDYNKYEELGSGYDDDEEGSAGINQYCNVFIFFSAQLRFRNIRLS